MMVSSRLVMPLAVMLYAVIGMVCYDDFGVSWDEAFQHDYGQVVFEYVHDGTQGLHEHVSRYHGPAFQYLLFAAERNLGLTDSRDVFLLRHLLTFAISILGSLAFYGLLRLFQFNRYWSVFGLLLLWSSPRIFAHSFFNTKDAVFMHLFIAAVYTSVLLLRKPSLGKALLHGIVCGVLIDVRILGIFVPTITFIELVVRMLKSELPLNRVSGIMALYLSTLIIVMIGFWPTLWHNPLDEIMNAFERMSAYPWDDPVLFEGSFQLPKDLPWYYIPKWIIMTTPLMTVILIPIGFIAWNLRQRTVLAERLSILIWAALPWLLITLKGSTVYDGWRHFFFIYPALLILAVSGASWLFGQLLRHRAMKYVPMMFIALPIWDMVQLHPQQQVYFNQALRKDAFLNYEMDYWGSSYREALEWLCHNRPNDTLLIGVANAPVEYNRWILPVQDRNRIRIVGTDEAELFVSNFRFPSEHTAFLRRDGFYQHEVKVFTAQGNPTVGIFRLNH